MRDGGSTFAIFGSNDGRLWTNVIPAALVASLKTKPGLAASAGVRIGPLFRRKAGPIAAKNGTAIIAA